MKITASFFLLCLPTLATASGGDPCDDPLPPSHPEELLCYELSDERTLLTALVEVTALTDDKFGNTDVEVEIVEIVSENQEKIDFYSSLYADFPELAVGSRVLAPYFGTYCVPSDEKLSGIASRWWATVYFDTIDPDDKNLVAANMMVPAEGGVHCSDSYCDLHSSGDFDQAEIENAVRTGQCEGAVTAENVDIGENEGFGCSLVGNSSRAPHVIWLVFLWIGIALARNASHAST